MGKCKGFSVHAEPLQAVGLMIFTALGRGLEAVSSGEGNTEAGGAQIRLLLSATSRQRLFNKARTWNRKPLFPNTGRARPPLQGRRYTFAAFFKSGPTSFFPCGVFPLRPSLSPTSARGYPIWAVELFKSPGNPWP
jgi:hypothetical protein